MASNEEILKELRDFRKEVRQSFVRMDERVRDNERNVAVMRERVRNVGILNTVLAGISGAIAGYLGMKY